MDYSGPTYEAPQPPQRLSVTPGIGYPAWVRQAVLAKPDWISDNLFKNPQWVNEQIKLHEADLFASLNVEDGESHLSGHGGKDAHPAARKGGSHA